MDRRTFARSLGALGIGLVACGEGGTELVGPPGPPLTPAPPPPPPPPPPPVPSYTTDLERARGVAAGLRAAAEPSGDGVRWPVLQGGAPTFNTDLYTGQSGSLVYLAEVVKAHPDADLQQTLEDGGRWLVRQPRLPSEALFEGNAGRAWSLLSIHEVSGGTDSRWIDAALAMAPAIAASRQGLTGDIINGPAGQALFLLELYRVTQDTRWLVAAREIGDWMLSRAVASGGGIKFPAHQLTPSATVFYTGLAHGAAGAGYVLLRIARSLDNASRVKYIDGALAAARWLQSLAISYKGGLNWYRREPDQMDVHQMQWCHGSPGIGIFFAELYDVTGDATNLDMAVRCADVVEVEGSKHPSSSQCHGVAGNAELFLKLYNVTNNDRWLTLARNFAEVAWTRRISGTVYPEWLSGDSESVHQPGLMTGSAGVGWLFLQLSRNGKLGGPIIS